MIGFPVKLVGRCQPVKFVGRLTTKRLLAFGGVAPAQARGHGLNYWWRH